MGSIAMDKAGNIAVGYSASSSAKFPSVYYTGRLASDPLGRCSPKDYSRRAAVLRRAACIDGVITAPCPSIHQ